MNALLHMTGWIPKDEVNALRGALTHAVVCDLRATRIIACPGVLTRRGCAQADAQHVMYEGVKTQRTPPTYFKTNAFTVRRSAAHTSRIIVV